MIFSPSDILELVETIWKLYTVCQNAPGEYHEICTELNVLHDVVLEVRHSKADGKLPSHAQKQHSLSLALENTDLVVAELQTLVDQHNRWKQKSQKKWISVVKFVAQDKDVMKRKLRHCVDMIQMSLSALASLSTLRVESMLQTILSEYRNETHARSVVSDALEKKLVAPEDLFEQFAVDLEDKDVHPDAIAFNSQFIMTWISNVSPDTEFDLSPTQLSPTVRLSPNTRFSAAETAWRYSAETTQPSSAETKRFSLIDGHWQQKVAPTGDSLAPPRRSRTDSTISGLHEHAEHIPHRAETMTSPESQRKASVASSDSWGFSMSMADLRLSSSISRAASFSSHRSKSSDWHPYDHPNFDYVSSMLGGFFTGDPFNTPRRQDAMHRIGRAFHQHDWKNNGYLTRDQVTSLLVKVLEQAKQPENGASVARMVPAFDRNHDGKINKQSFFDLTYSLIQKTAESKRRRIESLLGDLRDEAGEEAQQRPFDLALHLPWPLAPATPESGSLYVNTVTLSETSKPPSHCLGAKSFTFMVYESERCVKILNDFVDSWVPAIPSYMQSGFLQPLYTVREAALEFMVFGPHDHSRNHSDLDDTILCANLVSKAQLTTSGAAAAAAISPNNETAAERADAIRYHIKLLHDIREASLTILSHIQAFCLYIQRLVPSQVEPSVQNFPELLSRWEKKHVAHVADWVFSHAQEWPRVKNGVESCRSLGLLSTLEPVAARVLKRSATGLASAKSDQLWTLKYVMFQDSAIGNTRNGIFSSRKVKCKITRLDQDPKTLTSWSHKMESAVSWRADKQDFDVDDRSVALAFMDINPTSDTRFAIEVLEPVKKAGWSVPLAKETLEWANGVESKDLDLHGGYHMIRAGSETRAIIVAFAHSKKSPATDPASQQTARPHRPAEWTTDIYFNKKSGAPALDDSAKDILRKNEIQKSRMSSLAHSHPGSSNS